MSREPAQREWTPSEWLADPRPREPGHAGTGWALPGLANIHSHAFQRAMAGLAERRGPGADSFWSWRERMYALAARFDPDTLRDVAAQLYVEMLEAGYTSVCEFHYLHHAPDGQPYADPAAMSMALVDAAQETGIQLVLLPVLYQTGGFDGRALAARQQRFAHATDAYLRLLDRLRAVRGAGIAIGIAFHSLRAVPPAALREVLEAAPLAGMPIHIHIAEQVGEIDECLAARGVRPVQWLLDNVPVDARWCLVHATHLDPAEVTGIAMSGACVALCPTTEANLGDGLFPLRPFLDQGGCIGIGSDSHASVSIVEELRWLEYGQRLRELGRNIVAPVAGASCGETLYAAAFAGGWQACGVQPRRSGLLRLDADAVELAGRTRADILDGWLFGSSRPLLREVEIGGRRLVTDGRHIHRDAVEPRYRRALGRLLAAG